MSVIKSVFTFFNVKRNMSLSSQFSELTQSCFKDRPEISNPIGMNVSLCKLVTTMLNTLVVMKSFFDQ